MVVENCTCFLVQIVSITPLIFECVCSITVQPVYQFAITGVC